MITIFLNDQPISVTENITVGELAELRGIGKQGVAMAVNDIFIRQADWEKRILKEGDRVVFISAAYGG